MSECPICYDVIENNNNNIKTECGHEFHSNCFLENVAHNGFSCPCCRKELAKIPSVSDTDTDDDESVWSEDYEFDVEERVNNECLVVPLEYMIHKLDKKYSKRDLFKIIYTYNNENLVDECETIEENLFNDYAKLCIDYVKLNTEEKENELMTMEDKKQEQIEKNEITLVNDFETIIQTRIY